MKSDKSVVLAVVATAGFLSFAADLSYTAVDDERGWDATSAWSGSALPTASDAVTLNNPSIAVPSYLRITNGVTADASSLRIGGGAGLKVEQGGVLQLPASGSYNLIVGDGGDGSLVVDGGTVAASGWNLVVGNSSDSRGYVAVLGGAFTPASTYIKEMVIGNEGVGSLSTVSDLGFDTLNLRIGGNTAGYSVFSAFGCTLTASQCQIGGIEYYGTPALVTTKLDKPGFGEMVLSNATLSVRKTLNGDTEAQLEIGRFANGYGVLRGCGVVQGATLDANNVRVSLDNGQIVADGFGEESSLDLNTVISIRSNHVEISDDTTNGWYAVNKGAALFPRIYFETAAKTTVLGGWKDDTAPKYVNSVGVVIAGANAGWSNHLRGGFFSADRSDIHADALPSGQDVVGVWKIGITGSVSGSDVLTYTSASLDFRYDQSKVKTGAPLSLYRWDGSAWTKVATKDADSTYRISVSGLVSLTTYDGIYNVGTFALMGSRRGCMIIFR